MPYTINMVSISTKLEQIPRIGKKYANVLKRLEIETMEDLLYHFPFRYDDFSQTLKISQLSKGTNATIEGTIESSKIARTWKRKMMLTEGIIKDETGKIKSVWFNQPYVSDLLIEGKSVRISGKVSQDKSGSLYFSNPAFERVERKPTSTGRLVPVYPETEGLTSKWIRWQIQNIFSSSLNISDFIPEEILKELHLPDLKTALKYIHFPENEKEYILARKRFAFDEMFLLQLSSIQAKNLWQKEKSFQIKSNELIKNFINSLPFSLTCAQMKAIDQILSDLKKSIPMNRLLNGDVGSGKTIVAAISCLDVLQNKYQASIMAPTEILARQHFENISKLFSHLNITVGLLTNSYKSISKNNQQKNLKRDEFLKKTKQGDIDLIIGTHAIIQKDIEFKNLALIIVDEQHRFGVKQRAYLQKKIAEQSETAKVPHFLTMTATPIPRTLSLAFFGELDISVLDEMPKNRKPIITKTTENNERKKVYDFVVQEIKNGRQAYIIFPLVEQSEALSEVKAATQEHKRLSENVFPQLRLGLLHGKLKASEKEKVMSDFKEKLYDILVATSVVEVGVDVPNSTIMIIEHADRFGLSQLHQFRGRVGRGQFQSYCFLFTDSNTKKSSNRLQALVKSNNGFDIAQKDLEIRGPGQFFGTRQSGMGDISMENITNVKLIEISKKHAENVFSHLSNFPLLSAKLEHFTKHVHLE